MIAVALAYVVVLVASVVALAVALRHRPAPPPPPARPATPAALPVDASAMELYALLTAATVLAARLDTAA